MEGKWIFIKNLLIHSFAGTLDVDYKERVIKYLVDNELRTGQDADWKAMARLPQFKGKLTLRVF